jgi:hypothetical protein
MSDDLVWGHASERSPEQWQGTFATREEAVADGRTEYAGDFYVVSGHLRSATEFFPDADWIVEDAGNRACEECGEVAEDFPEASPEALKELDALLTAWVEEHVAEVRFWTADGDGELVRAE